MSVLSSRARSLKPSPTLALAAKAKELASQGKDVISLTVGEPDWDTFQRVKDSGIAAIKQGQTKYAPSNGLPELRKEIARMTTQELGVSYDPNDVVVTAGGKMVVFAALQVLCDEGDEVLIPAPFWVSYPPMTELAGGVPKIIECPRSANFKLTADQLEHAITPKTKLLILNSPSNPTGEMYKRDELVALADVLRKHPRILVLSDDIYNRLTLDGSLLAPHLLHVAPDLRSRVVVINGASKTFSMTGWRLGWALAEREIVSAMSNYLSQSVSCAAPFTQKAMVTALAECADDVTKAVAALKTRALSAISSLRDVPGIEVSYPAGAFYLWPSIAKHLGKTYKGKKITNSKEFAELLLQDELVAVVPGVEFGAEGYLRLSFVIEESRWRDAMERLTRFIKNFAP